MVTPPLDRFALMQLLNDLPSQQLDMLLFAVDAPSSVIPPLTAAQGDRTAALLRWAEAPTGCGLQALQQELAKIIPLPANQIAPAEVWNLPYPRNPFFTAREDILQEMRDALLAKKSAAFSGLGGIGKTQTAIEFAYRYRHEYQEIMWLRAAEQSELISSFVEIAHLLNLPASQQQDESLVIAAVKQWLATHKGWLLILDNADDIPMLREFLPGAHQGNVLLTSRAQATGIYQRIEIKKMQPTDGALLLLRRAKLIAEQAGLDAVTAEERSLAATISQAMDGLPLALDQAGAFIEETPSSLAEYWQLYQEAGARLLAERGELAIDHPSVTITFSLAFEKVLQRNPTAADLIRVCAFLAADAIPEEIFTQGGAELGENLSRVADKPLDFVKVIAEAGKFSLIYRNPSHKTFDIHRLVQEVLRAEMDEDNRRLWAERIVCGVAQVFPDAEEYANWQDCERLLPHARVAINWRQQYQFELEIAALLLNRTGDYLNEREQHGEAEPLYQTALSLRQRLLGEEHPDVASTYNNLAGLYESQGRYAEAEPLYQTALSLRQRLLGEEHPDVASTYNNLAGLYESQGRYAEAEPLYQTALSLRQRLLGEEHPDVASTYNNLAGLYESQGRYAEAEPLFQTALSLRQRLLGEEHPDVATGYNNLAKLYYSQGRYTEAEPLFQTALSLRQRLLGEEHPDVATGYNNLAALYYSQGRYTEAEPLFQTALSLRQRLLGEEHPDVASSYNNLAALYYFQGRYAEAEPLYQTALSLRQRLLGEEHPDVASSYNNLARLYESQGRYAEAEPLYQTALSLRQRLLGEEHPDVASSYNNLAELYRSQGRYGEAEPLCQTALSLRQRLLGEEHPSVATSYNNLAMLYESQGRYAEAEPLYEKALAIADRSLGVNHPNTITFRKNLQLLRDNA